MKPRIILTSSQQHPFFKGHPWVFPKAIAHQSIDCQDGQLVDIFEAEGMHTATGVFNANSLYRVRVLSYVFEPVDHTSIEAIVTYRLHQALLIRQQLDLPNAHTSAYRLFNSEGDGLSGLTIDRFNKTCIVSSSAYWVELHQNIIRDSLAQLLPNDVILWVAQPKPLTQDGWTVTETVPHQRIEQVLEAGIAYQVDFSNSQKTGLFLDQRENHQKIATLATGKRVLDLYTYTGGFALHAAKANALSVTAVDSSENAIALAKQNAQLNNLSSIEFIEDDARNYLSHTGDYDLIILDPPKLVPSVRHLERAKNYYRFLHREAFKHMKPGTLLMTCNCSSAMSAQQFSELVSMQARLVGKTTRTLGSFGPASCHPTLAGFPEGHYLSAILVAVV